MATSHVLEKGMSLPATRLGYGKKMLELLIKLIYQYEEKGYNRDGFEFLNAIGVLDSYSKFHEDRRYNIGDIVGTQALKRLNGFYIKRMLVVHFTSLHQVALV